MNEPIYIGGEQFLSVEVIAELYEVKAVWLREVCAHGLLASSDHSTMGLCIAAVELDRVGTIVRLHSALELDLEHIALLLDSEGL